jgi:hypothetical protein
LLFKFTCQKSVFIQSNNKKNHPILFHLAVSQ